VGDKEEEEIIALDAKSGEVRWREPYTRPGYYSGINRGPQATPAVIGGRVYSFGVNGLLTCFDAESGKRVWQVHAHKQFNASLPRYGVCCSPLVVGNRVLVSVGGKGSSVVAFDTETGEAQWQAFDDPASTSSPILFTAGGTAGKSLPDVVFMTSLRLIGVNPLDGSMNWEFPLVFQPAGASPTPLIVGDQLITSTITNGSTAIRIENKDEKPVASQTWQAKQLAGYFSSGTTSLPVGSAEGERFLYLITNVVQPVPTAALRCVEAKTGKELWKKDEIGYFHAGVIRTGDGKLLILDDSGLLRLAAVDEKGYTELCTARVCGGTLINHALSDGCVYVRDNNEVVCLQLSEPKKAD
jgi:outer membrane protein assembly factor BamB